MLSPRAPFPCSLHQLPRIPHTGSKLILAGLDPWRVVLFRDLDALVAKQNRDLIDGNSGQQHISGEGVAEDAAAYVPDLAGVLTRSAGADLSREKLAVCCVELKFLYLWWRRRESSFPMVFSMCKL